jgi:hypothetical protein
MSIKTIMGSVALAAFALSLGACASTSSYAVLKQAPPPVASAPEATTYVWQPTNDYQAYADQGFDENANLLARRSLSFNESRKVFALDLDCAQRIQEGVKGLGMHRLRTTLKIGGAEAAGALLGTVLGIPNATTGILREMGSIAGSEGGLVGLASGDEQLMQILSGAHVYCIMTRVQMHWNDRVDPMRHVVIVPIPGLHALHANVGRPGLSASDLKDQDGAEHGRREDFVPPMLPPPPMPH